MNNVTGLHEVQCALIAYLRDGVEGAEEHIADQPPLGVRERLSIYGTAYHARLHQTLLSDHEVLAAYLGDTQFADLTDAYLHAHPSKYRSLRHFGTDMPAFLRQTAPYSGLPILSEIAAFERRLLDVFDAPDAERVGAQILRARPTATWPEMRIRFHPSTQLFRTTTLAVPVWRALRENRSPPMEETSGATTWLLWRGVDRLSEFRSVDEAEWQLLHAALEGRTFAACCETLLPRMPEQDIGKTVLNHLMTWLDQGLICRLD
ncbi:MAG: putative DNA-binding domain-containing protein [Chromatiales bacterium]|nr:putative DNA-binding domain-containing protein [Chromatiales bacterium]